MIPLTASIVLLIFVICYSLWIYKSLNHLMRSVLRTAILCCLILTILNAIRFYSNDFKVPFWVFASLAVAPALVYYFKKG